MSKRPKPPPDGFRPPRVRKHHAGDTTDGEDACWLASQYRLTPDAWQKPIVIDWLTRDRSRKWAHGTCAVAVPRQNGKNATIEIRELYGLIVLGEAILHTAHELKTARQHWRRLRYFFGDRVDDPKAKFPELNGLIKEIRNTNGQEAIFLKDVCNSCDDLADDCECETPRHRKGGSIEIIARSDGSGRGFTVDLIVIDEAQHLSDEDLEAILPAKSSAPLGNPQVIYAGTPPDPEKVRSGKGEAWLRTRTRSLRKGTKRISWTEYGVPDGPMPDIDDLDLLHATNPSLGVRHANGSHGLTMTAVRDERAQLSDAGYARERYGWWGDTSTTNRGVIDMTKWGELKVAQADVPTRGLIVVDVSPNLEWSSIGLATDGPDGRPLVLIHRGEGSGWVADRVAKLVGDLTKTLEVALTPAAHVFSPDLTALKVEHRLLTGTEVSRGCTAFQTMVKEAAVTHVNQGELNDAVRTAVTRYVGTSGLQQWDDRGRKVDITPLVVASVAAQRWAAEVAKPPPPALKPRTLAQAAGGRRKPAKNINSIGF